MFISDDNLLAFEDFLTDFQYIYYGLQLLVNCEANEYSKSEWQRLLFNTYSLLGQTLSDFSVLHSCIRRGIDCNGDRD